MQVQGSPQLSPSFCPVLALDPVPICPTEALEDSMNSLLLQQQSLARIQSRSSSGFHSSFQLPQQLSACPSSESHANDALCNSREDSSLGHTSHPVAEMPPTTPWEMQSFMSGPVYMQVVFLCKLCHMLVVSLRRHCLDIRGAT